MVSLSAGSDWEETPGATVILQNSTFRENRADLNNGGVIFLADFSAVTITGHENEFALNKCGRDGSVLAAATNTTVTVEGGHFFENGAEVSVFLCVGLRLTDASRLRLPTGRLYWEEVSM